MDKSKVPRFLWLTVYFTGPCMCGYALSNACLSVRLSALGHVV